MTSHFSVVAMFAIMAPCLLASGQRDLPFAVLSASGVKATFNAYDPPGLRDWSGTRIRIAAADGVPIYRDRSLQRAVNAAWSPTGDFLVIAFVDGGGHSPWRYRFFMFSLAHRHLVELSAPTHVEFVRPDITFSDSHSFHSHAVLGSASQPT